MHNKNECSQNLGSVTHKVSDTLLHHEWQWVAAITPTASVLTVDVDTYVIVICSKRWANIQGCTLVGPILIEVEANMIFFIKSAFLLNTPRIEEEEEEEENG